MGDVDVAPDAAGFAWGETVREPLVAETADDAVDPAEAEGFSDGLVIGQPGSAGGLFVKPDLELGCRGVCCSSQRRKAAEDSK